MAVLEDNLPHLQLGNNPNNNLGGVGHGAHPGLPLLIALLEVFIILGGLLRWLFLGQIHHLPVNKHHTVRVLLDATGITQVR